MEGVTVKEEPMDDDVSIPDSDLWGRKMPHDINIKQEEEFDLEPPPAKIPRQERFSSAGTRPIVITPASCSVSKGKRFGDWFNEAAMLDSRLRVSVSCPVCGMHCDSGRKYWEHYLEEHWSSNKYNNYLCTGCLSVFGYYHACSHPPDTPWFYICGECGCPEKTLSDLATHVASCAGVSSPLNIACSLCPLVCTKMLDFRKHYSETHWNKKPEYLSLSVIQKGGSTCTDIHLCLCCGMVIPLTMLSTHANACHLGSHLIDCINCTQQFDSVPVYLQHFRDLHWSPSDFFQLACSSCGHLSKAPGRCCPSPKWKPLCSFCGEEFAGHTPQFKKHRKSCLGILEVDGTSKIPRECRECGESFFLPQDLAEHVKIEHGAGAVHPTCTYCTGEPLFISGQAAWKHTLCDHRTEALKNRFLCTTCGSASRTLTAYFEHQVYGHCSVTPPHYLCMECGHSCRTSKELSSHVTDQHPDHTDQVKAIKDEERDDHRPSSRPTAPPSSASDSDYNCTNETSCDKSYREIDEELALIMECNTEDPEELAGEMEDETLSDEPSFPDIKHGASGNNVRSEGNRNTFIKTQQVIARFVTYLTEQKSEEREVEKIGGDELDCYIRGFILQLKRMDGQEMEPDTLTSYHRGIERYLREKGYDHNILTSDKFQSSRLALQTRRKELKLLGKGNRPNRADPLTPEQVETLWLTGQMGDSDPKTLQDAIFFYFTESFGHRSAQEWREIYWGDFKISEIYGTECIIFNERNTKPTRATTSDGTRDFNPILFAVGDDRCPVRLFKTYKRHRPSVMNFKESPLFLTIKTNRKTSDETWYSNSPLGKNSLSRIVADMAKNAGLGGKLVNHSILRKQNMAGITKGAEELFPEIEDEEFTSKHSVLLPELEDETWRNGEGTQRNLNTYKKTHQVVARFVTYLKEVESEERDVEKIDADQLDPYIQSFLLQLKRVNGEEMEPDTLTSYHRGIERYLREKGYEHNILSSEKFHNSRAALQSRIKELKLLGKGEKPNRADVITPEQVETLWRTGQMGGHDPKALQNAIFFYFTESFGFRGAQEWRQLCWGDFKISEQYGTECIIFSEKRSVATVDSGTARKRNLKHRIFAVGGERCPVRLYKLYKSHRPPEMNFNDSSLFLNINTNRKQNDNIWYCNNPLGRNSLARIVSDMSKSAGLNGRFVNNSIKKNTKWEWIIKGADKVMIVNEAEEASAESDNVVPEIEEEAFSNNEEVEHSDESEVLLPEIKVETLKESNSGQMNRNTYKKTHQVMARFLTYLTEVKSERRDVQKIDAEELDMYIKSFILQLKRNNGEEMEPDTLVSYHRGIERYLREVGYEHSIVYSDKFSDSRAALQSRIKELKLLGKGYKPNRADTITPDQVETLWRTGQMGDSDPKALQNAIFFYFTQSFGYRGAQEWRQVCWGDFKISQHDGTECLIFDGKITKTLTDPESDSLIAVKPRIDAVGGERCPVRLFKLYKSHRPASVNRNNSPLFLNIKTNRRVNDTIWYRKNPLGRNSLARIVSDMSKNAGLSGRHVNHSLKKTLKWESTTKGAEQVCTKIEVEGLSDVSEAVSPEIGEETSTNHEEVNEEELSDKSEASSPESEEDETAVKMEEPEELSDKSEEVLPEIKIQTSKSSNDALMNHNTYKKTLQVISRFVTYLAEVKSEERDVEKIGAKELDGHIEGFILQLKRMNGEEMEPDTFISYYRGIERYLREKGYEHNILTSDKFINSRLSMESKMNQLKLLGKGNKPNRADVITPEQVEILWKTGQMADNNPKALQNAIFFYCSESFGSRGAQEWRQICWGDFEVTDIHGAECLIFNERNSRARRRAAAAGAQSFKPIVFAVGGERCPVRLFKIYKRHRPASMNRKDSPFFLMIKPNLKPKDKIWYSTSPIGKNNLARLVSDMARKAGLCGHLVNTSIKKKPGQMYCTQESI